MLIMQFKILPMSSELSVSGASLSSVGSIGNLGVVGGGGAADVSKPMLYLLLTQGFFTGLIIGKLAEGSFKFGLKHSFAMVALSLLIYTGATAFF